MKLLSLHKSLQAGRLTPAAIALLYAAFAALWIVVSGHFLTITVSDPVLMGRIELAKGLAFVAVTSGLLFLMLRVRGATSIHDAVGAPIGTKRLVLMFAALALIVPMIGFSIARLYGAQIEREAYANLESIARLKAEQIENWLDERNGDSEVLAGDEAFAERVGQFVQHEQDAKLSKLILDHFRHLNTNSHYTKILLLNTSGRVLLSEGKDVTTEPVLPSLWRHALASKQVQRRDMYLDEAGDIHLEWVVPMVVADAQGKHAVAVVVLRITAQTFIFPLIQAWPTASASGETLLVRREGESIMFLNELRHRKDTASRLTLPLTDTERPAGIAVLSDKPGTMQGKDYRDEQVLAAYRPVTGTDWRIIAKLDRAEVLAPLWDLVLWISLIALAAIAAVSVALLLLWRQQQRAHQVEMRARSMAAIEESERRYRAVTQTANDSIIIADSAGNVVEWNISAARMFGYPDAEILGQPLTRLMPERYREDSIKGLARVVAGGKPRMIGKIVEVTGLRKDGSEFPLEISLAQWQTASGLFFSATIRDITERKQAESNLKMFRSLLDNSSDAIEVVDLATLHFIDINETGCRILGYSREELLSMSAFDIDPTINADSVKMLQAQLRQSGHAQFESVHRRKDGSTFPVEISATSMELDKPYLLTIVRDITERKVAETKIQRLTQFYAALSQCNEAIVRCTSEDELFPQICRSAVEFGCMKMAWIGLVDETSKLVKPVVSCGEGTEYLEGLRISVAADDPASSGPVGTAIRNNQPQWLQDFQHDMLGSPWREQVARFGWGSAASLPLLRNGVVVGAFTLYAGDANAFDEAARMLLVEMAADISFALDGFDRETERNQSEQVLAESEQRFRSLVEQSIAAIYIIQDEKLVYANPRFAEIFGYASASELIGIDPLLLVAEQERGIVAKLRSRIENEKQNLSYSFTGVRKDGSQIEVGAHGARATHDGRPAVIGLLQDVSEKKHDEERIQRYVTQLEHSFMNTIEVATTLLEMRDPYTAGHEKRVALIAVAIAAELGLDAHRIEGLRVGGYIHDIGKIIVPAEILTKPGRLTAAEYALMKGHPQAGYDILKKVDFPWPVADIAYQHHERMDGSGYPRGLKGEEILLEARITAVADVVEAMASHRPYRPGLGIEQALAEIERGNGTLYDPVIVDICLRLFREQGFVLTAH